jgi:glycosyltransferase involved in cell wall biosynthesis
VLYIDHSFHQKTTSTQFMLEAFQKVADVDEYWDDSWQGGERFDPRKYDKPEPDLVVLFQTEPTPELFRYWRCPIAAIPMLDSPYSWTADLCLKATRSTVIAFGKKQAAMYRRKGMRVIPLTYACDPPMQKAPHEGGLRGFFWERGPVRWEHVKSLIGDSPLEALLVKQAPDPDYKPSKISAADIEKYRIQFVEPWGSKEDYWKLLSTCDVYFAPRPTEGIGMGYLEAMAMGLVVVAPDGPTMNEYIENGKNGIIFELKQPTRGQNLGAELGLAAQTTMQTLLKSFRSDLDNAVINCLQEASTQRNALTATATASAKKIISAIRIYQKLSSRIGRQFQRT